MDRRQAQAKPGHQPAGHILLYEVAVEVPDGGDYPERFRAEYLTGDHLAARRLSATR